MNSGKKSHSILYTKTEFANNDEKEKGITALYQWWRFRINI